MKKISIGVVCLILALVFGNTVILAEKSEGDEMRVPMGVIPLKPPESVEAQRPSVPFPHAVHFVYQCQVCHHAWETDEPIVGCKTSGCHDGVVAPTKAEEGEDPKELAVSYYKSAYHKMCISCHKEIKIQNKELENSGRVLKEKLPNSGPTTCRGCHKEE